ncbi:SprT-like family-domain-containing protein [Cyathus striatus]|nr:SprT-like family-domain-containing protein [Cyathus striatus]
MTLTEEESLSLLQVIIYNGNGQQVLYHHITGTSSTSRKLIPPRSEPNNTPPVGHSSKKVKYTEEETRRRQYAQKLFDELNRDVFANELPRDTKLVWNKRLLSTAGRAKWHRSRDGSQTTEIELAEKILDCDERIRNTLSHEMCHLACWIIDKNLKESHGKLWKNWALRVMNRRVEIKISTRHTYEITYPFRWECKNCSKIYGRFSKSIRPEEVVCGVCKEGSLYPLFETRNRTPGIPRVSSMAAAKQQGNRFSKHCNYFWDSQRRLSGYHLEQNSY